MIIRASAVYAACEDRDVRPVIPLKLTVNVAQGKYKPPSCQQGVWTFAGSDTMRGASKWWWPTGVRAPVGVGQGSQVKTRAEALSAQLDEFRLTFPQGGRTDRR